MVWHEGDALKIHPHGAEVRGVKDGDWARLASRSGDTSLRATLTDRVSPGVLYTTFHHLDMQANVITTNFSDWATNCPDCKVTAVQVSMSNGPTDWELGTGDCHLATGSWNTRTAPSVPAVFCRWWNTAVHAAAPMAAIHPGGTRPRARPEKNRRGVQL